MKRYLDGIGRVDTYRILFQITDCIYYTIAVRFKLHQQHGAAEARRAHNPEDPVNTILSPIIPLLMYSQRSKRGVARFFLADFLLLLKSRFELFLIPKTRGCSI